MNYSKCSYNFEWYIILCLNAVIAMPNIDINNVNCVVYTCTCSVNSIL